jgi:ribulose-phosphate 3-epimerase
MIVEPERQIAAFGDTAQIINVHVEVSPHLNRTLEAIRKLGPKAGVCLNPATPVSTVEAVLADVDQVMVMTINPGWGGQEMIERQLEKVTAIRRLLEAGGLGAEIEVDGGVKAGNAGRCVAAGADVLVCGSSVYNAEGTVGENLAVLRGAVSREDAARSLRRS